VLADRIHPRKLDDAVVSGRQDHSPAHYLSVAGNPLPSTMQVDSALRQNRGGVALIWRRCWGDVRALVQVESALLWEGRILTLEHGLETLAPSQREAPTAKCHFDVHWTVVLRFVPHSTGAGSVMKVCFEMQPDSTPSEVAGHGLPPGLRQMLELNGSTHLHSVKFCGTASTAGDAFRVGISQVSTARMACVGRAPRGPLRAPMCRAVSWRGGSAPLTHGGQVAAGRLAVGR